VPTHYAAVRLGLRKSEPNLNPELFELKSDTAITPALWNVRRLFVNWKPIRDRQTERHTDGRMGALAVMQPMGRSHNKPALNGRAQLGENSQQRRLNPNDRCTLAKQRF